MHPKQVGPLPWRQIDGRAVIIHPKRGEVHELNEVGTLLWVNADGVKSELEIAELVADAFDVDSSIALQDTREFYQTMIQHGLIISTHVDP